ncbi:hypothetical protein GCM10011351_28920 [Paraliobacillus quinghaiensis]|uniref:Uncharacterized protein n=1 Tax=Paraliobacillus quinghaiensis TaxID=470815 RepID=A0A917TXW5_9BACI|nr:hypothetical protein [Paraliobacillus quinghaiensis]GGM40909.1 hypothetical protein GCM10011351_28920 [Paraliobacillus quinghaiensis]
MLRKNLFLAISLFLLVFFVACTKNEEVEMKLEEENIEVIEKVEEGNTMVYKVKVEQPKTEILFEDKKMVETFNPKAILQITEDANGNITSKLLYINVSSNEDIELELPQPWNKVDGRSNTYSQLVLIKSERYSIAGVVEFTVVSPTDIDFQIKY